MNAFTDVLATANPLRILCKDLRPGQVYGNGPRDPFVICLANDGGRSWVFLYLRSDGYRQPGDISFGHNGWGAEGCLSLMESTL